MQCLAFQPPHHSAGIQALFEHSTMALCLLNFTHIVFDPAPPLGLPLTPANHISKSSATMNLLKDKTQVDNNASTIIPILCELPVILNTSVAAILDVLNTFSPLVINTIKLIKDDKPSQPHCFHSSTIYSVVVEE